MKFTLPAALTLLGLFNTAAFPWWGDGHEILTRAAFRSLPNTVPEFFRAGESVAANAVYDPDLFKNRGVPAISKSEHPEHFFDVELLSGPPQKSRYAFIRSCLQRGLDPTRVGLAPYAITEWAERLTVAFAEHRKWPTDQGIQSKCLVYAGVLSHYAADICQPLHVTVDFDGRASSAGSPHTGIHEKVDALLERLELDPSYLSRTLEPSPFGDLHDAVMKELDASYELVDRVYELEEELTDLQNAQVRGFGEARGRRAAEFTASLFLSAWINSEEIDLPTWLTR